MDEKEEAHVEWNEYNIYNVLKQSYEDLKELKPNDRSEKDRAIAVVLTDLEKILAYYNTYVI